MGGSGSSLEKAIRILESLHENTWVTASELARTLGVSCHKIFRYMRQIDMAFGGYPVFESSGSGYRLARSVLADIWSMRDEASAAASILASPYSGALQGSSNRLEKFLSMLQSRIRTESEIPPHLLKPVLTCFIEKRSCEIDYRTASKKLRLSLLPLRLVSEHGIHYLQCQDLLSKTIKLLAMDKMENLRIGPKETDKNSTHELLDFLDSAWGIMVTGKTEKASFSIDDDIKPYFLRNQMHWTQNIDESNGRTRIGLMVHNREELSRWLCRFGNHVKIDT